jgi:hypothetical protein
MEDLSPIANNRVFYGKGPHVSFCFKLPLGRLLLGFALTNSLSAYIFNLNLRCKDSISGYSELPEKNRKNGQGRPSH